MVEHGDILFRNLRKIFIDENISASILKYQNISILMNNLSQKPQAVILNLLDTEVLEELSTSSQAISFLHSLSLNGTYVLFATNDQSTIKWVSGLFDPPLSYPSSPKATATKVSRDGKTETIVWDTQMYVTGRKYISIGGRVVPTGVMASIIIEDPGNVVEAIQKALRQTLILIADLEINPPPRG